jgi:YHS domain-containing protein
MKLTTLVSASALLVACGGAAPAPATPATPSASSAPSSDVKAPGDAKIGDRTRCPVSGEEFTVTADSPHADYQGKTYYFCCPHCPEKFQADPSKYLGKPST